MTEPSAGATTDDYRDWDRRTRDAIEATYLARGDGQGGSGSGDTSPGWWRAKRQHLAIPMDADGDWIDIGCANGHLLVTLPTWAAEREVIVKAHGLELLAPVAEAARTYHPELADRIWTGSVMAWEPPKRFRYVTALADSVPPHRLGELIKHLMTRYLEPDGRLILSSYTAPDAKPRELVEDVKAVGRRIDGVIRIDRPDRHTLQTIWLDVGG